MHGQWLQTQEGALRKTWGSLEEPGEDKVEAELSHRTVSNRTMHYGVSYALGFTKRLLYEASGRCRTIEKVGGQRQEKVGAEMSWRECGTG